MSDKQKTVAESAYCDLLAMPLPKTARDFRRAIILAALIGRQIEADFQQQEQTNEPTCKTTHSHTWISSPRNTKSARMGEST